MGSDPSLRVHHLADEEANEILDALASDTARRLYICIHNEPGTPSELSDRSGLSVQNVHYHVGKLEKAGLIEQIGMELSEKGLEMKVYGPAADSLILGVSRRARWSSIRRGIERFVGAIVLLAASSVVVHFALTPTSQTPENGPASGGGPPTPVPGPFTGGGASTPTSGPVPIESISTISPGIIFFAGGFVILTLVASWRYYRFRTNENPLRARNE